jgi:hypothetical protein
MNTKRQVLSRERNIPITDEVLALFAELDSAPAARRRSQEFRAKAKEHELARMLDITAEWWTCNSVLNTSVEPCHPRGHVANDDWHRCREVRLALLAALAAEAGSVGRK